MRRQRVCSKRLFTTVSLKRTKEHKHTTTVVALQILHTTLWSLIEATPAQIVGDYDVSDGVKHELNVSRVGGARHVAVDLFSGRLVLRLELSLDVCRRLSVLLSACLEECPKLRITGRQ